MSLQTPPEKKTGEEPDPLATLHRMSTTAGVASQQYVAVNNTAIVAVIVGLVSAVAFLQPLLLFIPLAGIIISIFAWRQVRGSNGTETGLPLAILGLLISAGLGGWITYRVIHEHIESRKDIQTMSAIAQAVGADLAAGRDQAAYDRFNAIFRGRVTERIFELHWEGFRRTPAYGPIKGIEWNGVAPHKETVKGGDESIAYTPFFIDFQNVRRSRFTFVFRKFGDGEWQLEDIPEIFSSKPGQ
jgi:hypothetical protein